MPRDLAEFGTSAYPLHASGLRNFVSCPWREVMLFLGSADEEGGPAADTGSAVHAAAAAYRRGDDIAASMQAMREGASAYPQADLVDAANLFLAYASAAGRRQRTPVLTEELIRFSIAPSASDPTGAPIELEGTVDDVSEESGRLTCWDIKTTKKPPLFALRESQQQLAAYCVGATVKLGRPVHPGGLIMPRQREMFIPVTWAFEDLERILAPVREVVASVRAGRVYHVPSAANCEWCHAKGPDLCLPRMKRTLL